MTYDIKDTRTLDKIEFLIEQTLTGGPSRKDLDISLLDKNEYIEDVKTMFYLFKRFFIVNYESLNNFRKQSKIFYQSTRNLLVQLKMDVLKCDEDFKILLHLLDEIKYEQIFFEEEGSEKELLNKGVFPIPINIAFTGHEVHSYDTYMGDRKFVKLIDINKQCKALAISISKSVARFKDNLVCVKQSESRVKKNK